MIPQFEMLTSINSKLGKEIRVSFENDRHHLVVVPYPYTADNLAESLITLAIQLRKDPHLKG